ncbi:hypothetical protein D1AOALGA4SA_9509 [Olavius algarvensis Delta 1 endosymbiont]|nr:hypothetical protein D1AOALGA4SA_9509 [Olavius algarvensis Delta 1 endosymbiont]
MEYWVSKTDDGLLFISVSCNHYQIRLHSAIPIIPTFQHSNAFLHETPYSR